MEPVTKGDYNDLNERLSALEHYVEHLEERLDGQHQGLADNCEEQFGRLHQRLGGQPDTALAGLHKAAGDSQIQDVDGELEEERIVAEIQRTARGE